MGDACQRPGCSLNGHVSENHLEQRLKSALAEMAPVGVGISTSSVADNLNSLVSEELASTDGWALSRLHEFSTGRVCARRAMEQIGRRPEALVPDSDGVPCWPAGVQGSITHSRGLVASVASDSENVELIGLDLEKTNRLKLAAMRRILNERELDSAGTDVVRASVFFSLKEAFYKMQYPRFRTVGNFSGVALNVDFERNHAKVEWMSDCFAPELSSSVLVFRIVEDYVVSLSWLAAHQD